MALPPEEIDLLTPSIGTLCDTSLNQVSVLPNVAAGAGTGETSGLTSDNKNNFFKQEQEDLDMHFMTDWADMNPIKSEK